ncbi:NAD-dependent malic enzyme 59 kDa isoform, mitochondrial-like isoform X2 [Lathyrus oleraceus]|nr:NAD-dependent malic enzyme 59 kDa isoform, mitochondrial-like isoform X2 [Pisum sativum]
MKWAFETLERYKKRFCMFNDDIQGTAGVALAGLLGTVKSQGRPLSDFVNQKIVVVGAGRARGSKNGHRGSCKNILIT